MGDMSPNEGYRLGVDVGGTFTDICVISRDGDIFRAKVPSTPHDQSIGIRNGIAKVRMLLADTGSFDGRFDYVHHGTTIATNAVLEGKGARTGLIVTDGHKDILALRRSHIPGGLGAWINYQAPEPIVPQERTIVCPERISISGEVIKELDEDAFRHDLIDLKRQKVESISVCLLNSFSNDNHEKKVCEILEEEFGADVEIVRSSNVLPLPGEYERTETTTTNAVVKPVVKRYLRNLQNLLSHDSDTLRILKSDGDLTSVDLAGELPVNILMSGPAGGVKGVSHVVAANTAFVNLLTLDMGGTSTDCALIPNAVPAIRRETVLGGLTVKAPSVDVRSVGAGGGSIAVYNELTKSLRVGPESSGASPGPAAYGIGGKSPTVTDANFVLGYLPSRLLGGDLKLDLGAAVCAVETIAKPMGISVAEAAEGIINLVNENMYGALHNVSIEQGYDPRDFALVAFGGAGPFSANAVGELLGSWPVIVPPSPGVLCAHGDTVTKLSHEASTSYLKVLAEVTSDGFQQATKTLRDSCMKAMRESLGLGQSIPLKVAYEVDLRYKGQAINLTIYLTERDVEKDTTGLAKCIRTKLDKVHTQQFSFSLASQEIEIMRLRVKVTDNTPEVGIKVIEKAGSKFPPDAAVVERKKITVKGKTMEAKYWDRTAISKQGYVIEGPAVITEMDSNTLILPEYYAEIDQMGNILIWPMGKSEKQARKVSEQSTESAMQLVANDPLIATLISSSLQSIRREMDTLMLRCAMSPAIREQQDEFNVISNTQGQMLVGQFGSFIPSFLESWKGTIEEGDVFMTNDVYQVRGAVSHLNDIIVMLPIWFGGRIVGWAANFGHLTDVQGSVPGSMSINATTIFEDGLQIPCVKLYSKGVYNESLVEVFRRNSRLPDWFSCDLTALVAACRTAAARVCELCLRYGVQVYEAACNELLHRNRSAIAELINNKIGAEKSTFTDFVDDDGHGVGPWAVKCTMQKVGEKLVFDWDGTSPQSSSSINFYLSETMFKMFAGYYLLAVYDPFCVVNDGFHDLLEIKIPEGSLLKPVRPASVSCRTHFLGRVMDILQALFGQRNSAYRAAAGFSDSPHLFYSGFKPTGDFFVLYQIGFGGVPARPVGDGPDCHCLFPAIKSVPTEFLELYFPLLILVNEALPSSGGAGFYRGGNAQRTVYKFLCTGNVSLHDDRWFTKPWGANGGKPGGRSRKVLYKRNRAIRDGEFSGGEALPSKADNIRVQPGDMLEYITWGGGGLGDPLTRDPEKVALEVHRKLVTIHGAKQDYGVVVDPTDFRVYGPETTKQRDSMRAESKTENGKSLLGNSYDRGGTLLDLVKTCVAETGLYPPTPQWVDEPYGPHVGLDYVKEWYKKMREKGYEGWDV